MRLTDDMVRFIRYFSDMPKLSINELKELGYQLSQRHLRIGEGIKSLQFFEVLRENGSSPDFAYIYYAGMDEGTIYPQGYKKTVADLQEEDRRAEATIRPSRASK